MSVEQWNAPLQIIIKSVWTPANIDKSHSIYLRVAFMTAIRVFLVATM